MKRIVTALGVFVLSSTGAIAREPEPTIEINIDVLQALMPAPAPVETHAVAPVAKPTKAAPAKPKKYKPAQHKKAKKPVAPKEVIKEEAPKVEVIPEKPVETPVKKPEIPAIEVPQIPAASTTPAKEAEVKTIATPIVATPIEAPKAEEKSPAPVVPTEAPKAEEKPAVTTPPATETPKAEEKTPVVALPKSASPAPKADFKQQFQQKTDAWLLQIDTWQNNFKQWLIEKKNSFAPHPTPAPAVVKPAIAATPLATEVKPAPIAPALVASTAPATVMPSPILETKKIISPAASTPVEVKPVATSTSPVVIKELPEKRPTVIGSTQLKPFTVPAAEEAAHASVTEVPKKQNAPTQKSESERLREKMDVWLLQIDEWQTSAKNWFNKKTTLTPVTASKSAKEHSLSEAVKTLPEAAKPVVIAPISAEIAKPADTQILQAESKPEMPVAAPAAPVAITTKPSESLPPQTPPENAAEKPSSTPVLYTVLFAAGEDVITEADLVPLDALARKLEKEKETRISVLGSAPLPEGMQESETRKLSLKRAIAVRQLLIKEGIDSTRINVRALGSDTQEVVKDRVDIVRLR